MKRSVPLPRVADFLTTDRGLTADEVSTRRDHYGVNDIIEAPPGGWRDLARDTARDPMIWFLAATSGLFAALGDYAEALTLLVAMVPLVGMDAFLHRRTQASTQGLASRLAAEARVYRDGEVLSVPARDLVPGDLVEVGPGELFPADGLFVGGVEMQVDESVLTGEALPLRKQPLPRPLRVTPQVDAAHWAFAGTRLLTGQARIRLVHTGRETLYGEIVRSALQGAHARTPLQAAVANLVGVLVVAALIMCVILAAIRLNQGHGWVDATLSAVTLAVAALPEEFPVALTFFLGVGVYRLARRQALVRRAVAVENIGRVTCICTDKTGTLTEGRLVLAHRDPAAGTSADQLLNIAALAARSDSGDPLDTALLDANDGRGDATDRIASFPFTEDRRRETAVRRQADGSYLVVTKGAPETILAMCRLEGPEGATWLERMSAYTSMGHKVIACASCSLAETAWSGGEPDRGFRLAGLLAFEDPVRAGVRDAVEACREAGIRVIMITGDHPSTAAAVAREIGLGGDDPKVIAMNDGDAVPEVLRPELPPDVDVVARAFPSQKLDIVQGLQAKGEIVAVTGDGVNDVPALQAADIGIAMGERGTRSAREVAAIVLLDDNFRSIVRAIAEGRQLFRNLQLSFAYLLIIHIPLVLSAAIIPLAGYPLLYLPIHIVWLELVIHPTALLVFQELPTSDRLLPVERRDRARFFGLPAWLVIGGVGAWVTLTVVLGYRYALGGDGDVEHARSMAIVALLIASVATTASLSRLRSWAAWIVVLGSLASLLLLVQVPALAHLVHLRPLHLDDWIISIAAGAPAGVLSLFAPLALRR